MNTGPAKLEPDPARTILSWPQTGTDSSSQQNKLHRHTEKHSLAVGNPFTDMG